MPPSIRPLLPADLPEVVALVVAVLAEHAFAAQAAAVEADLRDALDRYVPPRAGFWVADQAGAVVGTVAVRPKEAGTCELKRLYLRDDLRGSGLGQQLLEHAERFARGAGYQKLWLDSSRRFARARRLYERNGLVRVASLDNAWEDDVYEKPLG